jgi:hypothetical protein
MQGSTARVQARAALRPALTVTNGRMSLDLRNPFDACQHRALTLRAECLLCSLLEVSNGSAADSRNRP